MFGLFISVEGYLNFMVFGPLSMRLRRHGRLLWRRLSNRDLSFTDRLLDLAFDLPARISSHRSGDVIGFSLDLVNSACCNILLSHDAFL